MLLEQGGSEISLSVNNIFSPHHRGHKRKALNDTTIASSTRRIFEFK
jgi:hypothetical protein